MIKLYKTTIMIILMFILLSLYILIMTIQGTLVPVYIPVPIYIDNVKHDCRIS